MATTLYNQVRSWRVRAIIQELNRVLSTMGILSVNCVNSSTMMTSIIVYYYCEQMAFVIFLPPLVHTATYAPKKLVAIWPWYRLLVPAPLIFSVPARCAESSQQNCLDVCMCRVFSTFDRCCIMHYISTVSVVSRSSIGLFAFVCCCGIGTYRERYFWQRLGNSKTWSIECTRVIIFFHRWSQPAARMGSSTFQRLSSQFHIFRGRAEKCGWRRIIYTSTVVTPAWLKEGNSLNVVCVCLRLCVRTCLGICVYMYPPPSGLISAVKLEFKQRSFTFLFVFFYIRLLKK